MDMDPQVVEVPDEYGPIARIYLPDTDLPAGFVLLASASFNNPGAEEALVGCHLSNQSFQESTERAATLGPPTPAGDVAYDAATIAVQAIITPDAAGWHSLECSDNGGSVQIVSVPQSEITAIKIDEVRGGLPPGPS
jgi:hypothetical protein